MTTIRTIITTALIILLGLYAFQAVFSMVRFGGIQWIHVLILTVLIAVAVIWFRTSRRPRNTSPDAREAGGGPDNT